MNWQDALSYTIQVFWDPDGTGLPDVDVARNIAFTLLTFTVGWMVSLSGANKRQKARVIDELILSQSELMARAYPRRWKQDDAREAWMLDPFVERIRFLHTHLTETRGLRTAQLDLVWKYIKAIEEFIDKWAEAQRRNEAYDDLYKDSYWALRRALKALGLKEMTRLTGLMPDGPLFKRPPPKDTPPPAAAHASTLALAPAE